VYVVQYHRRKSNWIVRRSAREAGEIELGCLPGSLDIAVSAPGVTRIGRRVLFRKEDLLHGSTKTVCHRRRSNRR
jgi:hypothetical protein